MLLNVFHRRTLALKIGSSFSLLETDASLDL